MKISLTFPAKYLLALKHLAPVKDVRKYLEGVILDGSVPSCPVLLATDGTVLGVIRLETPLPEAVSVRIPNGVLARTPASAQEVTLTRTDATPTGSFWELAVIGAKFPWYQLAEAYPDWRRVTPSKCSTAPSAAGHAPQFNPRSSARMLKAVQALGVKKTNVAPFTLVPNADTGALVRCALFPEFVGLIQPLRLQEKLADTPPAWVHACGEENDFA